MINKLFGALPQQHILNLISNDFIERVDRTNVKPASLDLGITDEIFEIPDAFQVPKTTSVWSVLKQFKKKKVGLNDPLLVGKYYIAKINEKFNLPSYVYAYANPKSTTGRLDMHVRVIADGIPVYDALSKGFSGDVWVEIKPQSFSMKLHPGTQLNQVRLFYSDTRLDKLELEETMQRLGLLFYPSENNNGKKQKMFYKDMQIQDSPDSIVLCLDTNHGMNDEPPGYRAKKTNEVIDFSKRYKKEDFFVPIEPDKNERIRLPKESFSILSSIEHVSVPGILACEMASLDDRFGEFRSHYAGFIDPGWGWLPDGSVQGRPLTLEVRTFENISAYHGQPVARIKFETLAESPAITYDAIASNYIQQPKAKLAKQFY